MSGSASGYFYNVNICVPFKSISGSLGDMSCLSIDLSISSFFIICILPRLDLGNSSYPTFLKEKVIYSLFL